MTVTQTQTKRASTQVGTTDTKQRVLNLVQQLDDPQSWLHQRFYDANGVQTTPLRAGQQLANSHKLLLKDETVHTLTLQGVVHQADSFKRRGALLAGLLAQRDDPQLQRFVTASHGNHGIGVAMAARSLGVQADIYCPESVNATKLRKLTALGARLHRTGLHTFEEAMATAEAAAEQPGAALIHPFNQTEVIAGQASIGLETVHDLVRMEQRGEVDLHKTPIELVVAVAGGGLVSGVALVVQYYKALGVLGRNNVQVVGAQMAGCDAARRCVDRAQQGGTTNTTAHFVEGEFNEACDSTAVREVGSLTLPFMVDPTYVQAFQVVSEAEVGHAMQQLQVLLGRPIEPAGALAYAAAHKRATVQTPNTVYVATVCGANVTADTVDYFRAKASKLA